MTDLDEREALVLAVFAQPDDDLPRLVYADWLEEHGEATFAEIIRVQCALAHDTASATLHSRYAELTRHETPHWRATRYRGFHDFDEVTLTKADIEDAEAFRRLALTKHPEYYRLTSLKITGGLLASSKPITTLLTSPVLANVKKLDLSGELVDLPHDDHPDWDQATPRMMDFELQPVITLQAVEALVGMRECRRLTHLDLRNNNLDNDAARAIVRSTNLIRIQRLELYDNNQLRGRTWQQLLDRFGEDVVG
jgi:uncharacterized protein (TIGR02996 family)